jgi:hypothetical protein
MLVGVLNYINVPQLPVTALKLCFFNRWTAGFGQFSESVRLISPDQTTILRKSELKFALQDVNLHATNVTVLGQVKFEMPGAYYVEVLVDDVMKLRFPLVVNIVKPPEGQGSGPTAVA